MKVANMNGREQTRLDIVPFEKEHGYGVDLMLRVYSRNREVWLVEIKSCNINISDAHDAIRQFENTEKSLSNNDTSIRRILLHDNRKGCRISDKALTILRSSIRYILHSCKSRRPSSS